ncbi:hypothetical protein VTK26DRAFT_3884 [Humicola hyalothermophila]
MFLERPTKRQESIAFAWLVPLLPGRHSSAGHSQGLSYPRQVDLASPFVPASRATFVLSSFHVKAIESPQCEWQESKNSFLVPSCPLPSLPKGTRVLAVALSEPTIRRAAASQGHSHVSPRRSSKRPTFLKPNTPIPLAAFLSNQHQVATCGPAFEPSTYILNQPRLLRTERDQTQPPIQRTSTHHNLSNPET